MSEPLDLEPIKALSKEQEKFAPCQECSLDGYVAALIAEVEKLRDGIRVAVEVIDQTKAQVDELQTKMGWKVPD